MKRVFLFLFLLFVLSYFVFPQEDKATFEKNLISSKEEIQTTLEGKFLSPSISPSGKMLAFSKDNFRGIYLLNLENGKVIELTNLEGSGFGFEWQGYEDVLTFRGDVGNLRRKHFIAVAHPDGKIEVSSPLLEAVSLPVWIERNIAFVVWGKKEILKIVGPDKKESCSQKVLFFASPEGRIVCFKEGEKEKFLEDGKVFFLPRYSKDGKNFIFHCLDGGIYYGSVDSGSLKKIAEGSEARFARDDSAIIFEKTKDDGHKITESDLFLYDIKSGKTFQLTDTKEIERMPSMANDGHTVFWIEDGKIMRGFLK